MSDICEQGDDEDEVPVTQKKPITKKRKRTVCITKLLKFSSLSIVMNFRHVQKDQILAQVLLWTLQICKRSFYCSNTRSKIDSRHWKKHFVFLKIEKF
jgi:hypothetical protein